MQNICAKVAFVIFYCDKDCQMNHIKGCFIDSPESNDDELLSHNNECHYCVSNKIKGLSVGVVQTISENASCVKRPFLSIPISTKGINVIRDLSVFIGINDENNSLRFDIKRWDYYIPVDFGFGNIYNVYVLVSKAEELKITRARQNNEELRRISISYINPFITEYVMPDIFNNYKYVFSTNKATFDLSLQNAFKSNYSKMSVDTLKAVFNHFISSSDLALSVVGLSGDYDQITSKTLIEQMKRKKITIQPAYTKSKWIQFGNAVAKKEKSRLYILVEGKKIDVYTYSQTVNGKKETNINLSFKKDEQNAASLFDYNNVLKNLNVQFLRWYVFEAKNKYDPQTKTLYYNDPFGIRGYADASHKMLTINAGLNTDIHIPEATFFHEIGHVILGHMVQNDTKVSAEANKAANDLNELEAEFVSIICLNMIGSLSGLSNVELIKSLKLSDLYVKRLKSGQGFAFPVDSMQRVIDAADKIIKAGFHME